ncbi:hypothetical protein FS749_006857 [Ceratobasidium sp. UAMH 11750]|nr:hypothetical protein FS749_006857 [Ceratobasidium sp. UAMH 11750]
MSDNRFSSSTHPQPVLHSPVQGDTHPVVQSGSETRPASSSRGQLGRSLLSASLYHGPLSRRPAAHLIGNAYSDEIFWDASSKSLKMLSVKGDIERMTRWATGLIGDTVNVHATSQTDRQTIENIFKSCFSTPTLLYVDGRTDEINGEPVYLPSDCSDDGTGLVTSGIPYATMRQWLAEAEDLMNLVVITDVCKCTNIFGLPFMAEKINGTWVWTETDEYDALGWWVGTKMLHFTSTSPGEDAVGCQSAGGIYTRGFSDVWPRERVTLGTRLDRIQAHMDKFFDQWATMKGGRRFQQHHQLYSSYKLDFNDTNVFQGMGLY